MTTTRTQGRTPWQRKSAFPAARTAVAFAVGCLAAGLGLGALAQVVAPPPPVPSGAAAAAPSPTASAPVLASTEAPFTLRQAVEQAVLHNPEVLSRWHSVKAADAERDAARGGFLPRVDLNAVAGPERRSTINGQYSRSFGSLTLTQLLYDGFATASEVRRLDHATRTRLFELISASENTALEAVRAYFDVMRYRELVRLAEDNFVEHRAVYSQTDARVKAKVARAVDLEQITGRLALAEANLLIETSNLHDTTARFQRIVGRLPGRNMPLPAPLDKGVPGDAATVLARAQQAHPSVLAAVENVRASDAALRTRQAAYHPRLDFRLKRDQGRNLEGIPGNSNVSAAEIVLSWNLFNGFADRNRERQFAEQLNVAKDLRDKTCRDVRQTAMIAHNDVVKLKEQIEYLLVHEAALSKALTAYRQQFHIGQRTLLDLLDTENELFQARRAVVNARQDLYIAHARTHAGIGTLLQALEIAGPGTGLEQDLQNWSEGSDAARECPAEPVTVYAVDKDALVQRAMQLAVRTQLVVNEQQRLAEERAAQEAGRPASSPSATPARAAGVPAAPAPAEEAVKAALEAWRAAWAKRDLAGYLRSYGPEFAPAQGLSREAWEKRRRGIIGSASDVTVDLSAVTVTMESQDRAKTSFVQSYRSASYRDVVRKTLEWQRVDGRWVIVRETAEPAPSTR